MNKIKQHFQLLTFYTSAKLEAESFRHFAGYLWWILDPVLNVAIYYFLFKVVMKRGENDYIAFLVVGLIIWKWMADSLNKGSVSVLGNLPVLKKIKLQPQIFPMVELLYCSWKFLTIFTLMVFVLGTVMFGFSVNHFFLITQLSSTFIFLLGLVLLTSSLIPFLPDLGFVITYSLRLIFYASCVLFSEKKIPDEYLWVFHWNPFAVLIKSFRSILIDLKSPAMWSFLYPIVLGLIFAWIGHRILEAQKKEYAKLF